VVNHDAEHAGTDRGRSAGQGADDALGEVESSGAGREIGDHKDREDRLSLLPAWARCGFSCRKPNRRSKTVDSVACGR
jgi:hypothetical protein